LVTGDAYQLPKLVREHVDFVFLANVFHGVPERAKLVAAVRDLLKPGGLFAVVNWHPRPREETCVLGEPRGPKTELRMSAAATVRDGEAGGLSLVRVVELPPYHYGVMLQRA
jgi:SAM-dependent methyltransferase